MRIYIRYIFVVIIAFLFYGVSFVDAASLGLSPNTGVYSAGATFSVRVVVNTQGKPINAAEGELSFNPDDLSVISVSKTGSIFSLWTREPEFSNTSGKVFFGGGSPSGYTGSAGTVMTVTFRTKHAGTTNVTYAVGSILAADGKGTNVVSGMQGGAYTVQAVTVEPTPEYVPPPNTPKAPAVVSKTHPEQTAWYKETQATLSWSVPADVVAVRTLLDTKPTTVPTKVYETPITNTTLDLDQGTSYFHIQFKNTEGWGRVTSYRLNVDSTKPESFEIVAAEDNDTAHPEQKVLFLVKDQGSGIQKYQIQIDGGERTVFEDTKHINAYTTPALAPGVHTMVVEAFDYSGNSITASYTFTIESFDAPHFTEYPTEITNAVIPVIKGNTRENAEVTIFVAKVGTEASQYVVHADGAGMFVFIPESRFADGVYEVWATAKDVKGGVSRPSEKVRIAVQEPGLIRLGGMAVQFLSVLIPLLALLGVLCGMMWYALYRYKSLRKKIYREAVEVEQSLAHEFKEIVRALQLNVVELTTARKGRLTKQEQGLVEALTENLAGAERRIQKEIGDIEKMTKS